MVLDSFQGRSGPQDIKSLTNQIEKSISSLNSEVQSKLTLVSRPASKSNHRNQDVIALNDVELSPQEKETQLALLDKIWVVKNLIKELELSYEQNFAFQYLSINYNLKKLHQKIDDLKKYVNEVETNKAKQLRYQEQQAANTPKDQVGRSNSIINLLPGGFADFSPENLQKATSDIELLDRDASNLDANDSIITGTEYSKNVIILKHLESKLADFNTLFYEKLLELVDKFLVVSDGLEIKVLKQVISDPKSSDFVETLTVFEFFEFIDENHSTLVENNSDIAFRKSFNEKLVYFLRAVNQIINKTIANPAKSFSKASTSIYTLEFLSDENSDEPYYALTLTSTEDNNSPSFTRSILNIYKFTAFFIHLPRFLKYALKNNPNSAFFKALPGYFSFNILVLISGYNSQHLSNLNACVSTIKRNILLLIKVIYLIINLKILNKSDFYFLSLNSKLFETPLTVNSSNENFLSFLQVLETETVSNGSGFSDSDIKLWDANVKQLNEFFVEKKLNQIINQIKFYLQKFDTYDIIFHELINRFEINFANIKPESQNSGDEDAPEKEITSDRDVKQNQQNGASVTAKTAPKKVHKHQPSFSSADVMAPINETGQFIDSALSANAKKTINLVNTGSRKNNRTSSIFAAQGENLFGNSFDDDSSVLLDDADKSFNQSALDVLTGKTTSSLTPVTPLSPFDASNNARFSNVENKRPEDDRIRFSKRFSKNASISGANSISNVSANSSIIDDAGSVHSTTSNNRPNVTLDKRASMRISKQLSKRFSQSDWSWNDDAASIELGDDDDAWGNDEDLDLDISDVETNDRNIDTNNVSGKLQQGQQPTVTKKQSSKSIGSSNLDELDDWGWGDDIDENELNLNAETTVIAEEGGGSDNVPKKENRNVSQKKSVNFENQEPQNKMGNFKKVNSFKTTLIPDEIYKIISNFVIYLSKLNEAIASQQNSGSKNNRQFISNEELLSKVTQLIDIFYLVGGYAKYDSKLLFYNDVFYLNMILKKQLILLNIFDNPALLDGTSRGPVLFDHKIENYLTNVINLEKISLLRIYRKFQKFSQLSDTQNSNMVLAQLEFKFKEMFFASFTNLSKGLQQMVVVNFLSEFYQLVVNDILQIDLISEQDSEELSKIISHVLNFVQYFDPKPRDQEDIDQAETERRLMAVNEKDLSQDADETVIFYKKNISNFFKLANFKVIVSSHLAGIMENFYNGEFYNIETPELIHLIQALFVDSEIRRRAIQEIVEIRNIDI